VLGANNMQLSSKNGINFTKEAKMIEEIRLSLKDDQYPHTKITHTRHAVRAVCFNSDNKICLVHIKAIDQLENETITNFLAEV